MVCHLDNATVPIDEVIPGPANARHYSENFGYVCIAVGGVFTCLCLAGALGLILNTIMLVYFTRMKTQTENTLYTKIAFLNLVSVDLLLSVVVLTLRGPGLAWPRVIWGDIRENGHSAWCEAGAVIIWVVSDINVLGVLPLTIIFYLLHSPYFKLSKLNVAISIIICWIIPVMDIFFIYSLIWSGKICVEYKDVYGRCSFEGPGEQAMKVENSVVFYAIPFFLHVAMWSYIVVFVCRQGNGLYNQQWRKFLLTGVIVIVAFTITWLPYFVVVPWQDIKPRDEFTIVFIFLYSSVIINPIIYGTRSMRFNGRTLGEFMGELLRECNPFRSRRTSSLHDHEAGAIKVNYSSYDELEKDDGISEMRSTENME